MKKLYFGALADDSSEEMKITSGFRLNISVGEKKFLRL